MLLWEYEVSWTFKYLRVLFHASLKDDSDTQVKSLYCAARKTRSTFVQWSTAVKGALVPIACQCMPANCGADAHTFVYSRGLQTFLSEDHIRYYMIVRGSDFLRNVIVSGKVAFHQINKFFVNVLFYHHCQNGFAGRMKWLRGPHLARGP